MKTINKKSQMLLIKSGPRFEQRRMLRIDKNILIGFREADSLVPYKLGITKNVTTVGFMFEVTYLCQSIQAGQILELTINENNNKDLLKFLGRVVWVKESELSFKTQVGVELIFMGKRDQIRIKSLLK